MTVCTAPAAARRARRAVTLASFLHAAVFTNWVPEIPEVQAKLGLSTAGLAHAFLGVAVGPAIMIPVAGWAASRLGSRRVLRLMLLTYTVALALPALATGPTELFAALVLLSAANGGLAVAMNAHGVTVQSHYRRPIFASIHAANSFGGLVGAGMGTLATATGIPAATHLAVAAAVFTVVGVAGTRRLLPGRTDRAGERSVRWAFPRSMVGLGGLALCIFLAEAAVTNWSTVYLRTALGATATVASLGFIAFAAAMGIGRLATDPLIARFEPVRTIQVGLAVGATGLVVAVRIGQPAAAIIGLAFFGAGLAATVPAVMLAAGNHPGIQRAAGIAAISTVGYLGFLTGPALFGLLAGGIGLPDAFGGLAVLSLTAVGLAGTALPARPGFGARPEERRRLAEERR